MCPVIGTTLASIGSFLGIGGGTAAAAGSVGAAGISLGQGATLAAAGLGAVGSLASGIYNANVNRANARIAESNARLEQQAAELEIVQHQRQVAQAVGLRRAEIGASGVETSGSPLRVLASDVEQGALDTQIIRSNALNRSSNLRFQAGQLRSQARLGVATSALNAGGTLLSGASRANLFGT